MLDFAIEHAVSSVTVIESGVLAVSAARLAALTASFLPDAVVSIATDGTTGRIVCNKSRSKLPAIPVDDIPAMLRLDEEETGRVTLPRADAVKLFMPTFAMSNEVTRYYLNGLFLHDIDSGLAAVCTNGIQLAKLVLPGMAGLSQDGTLIIPAAAVKIASRLLADRTIDSVILRRSKTLFALEGAGFRFVGKLIDGTFPDYKRIIPPHTTDGAIIVDRNELIGAIARLRALADAKAPIGLQWSCGSALQLCLADHPGVAEDEIAATSPPTGTGRIAIAANFLTEQLNALASVNVRLYPNGTPAGPLVVTDPDNPHYLGLVSPIQWPLNQTEGS